MWYTWYIKHTKIYVKQNLQYSKLSKTFYEDHFTWNVCLKHWVKWWNILHIQIRTFRWFPAVIIRKYTQSTKESKSSTHDICLRVFTLLYNGQYHADIRSFYWSLRGYHFCLFLRKTTVTYGPYFLKLLQLILFNRFNQIRVDFSSLDQSSKILSSLF